MISDAGSGPPDAGLGDDGRFLFRLCITGPTPRSARAIVNIRRLCDEHLAGVYDLEIVDISLDPAAAVSNNIIAVPTLIKRRPLPEQRFIGDLSETDRLLRGLDVVALPPITPRTVPDARTD
ncbi:MAG: circadian clock KaiB family protein [Gemmatimonadota bacterium]